MRDSHVQRNLRLSHPSVLALAMRMDACCLLWRAVVKVRLNLHESSYEVFCPHGMAPTRSTKMEFQWR